MSRGYSPKFLVGLYGASLKNLALFQTKICGSRYVAYFRPDPNGSIPYFRPLKLVHVSNTRLQLTWNGFKFLDFDGER